MGVYLVVFNLKAGRKASAAFYDALDKYMAKEIISDICWAITIEEALVKNKIVTDLKAISRHIFDSLRPYIGLLDPLVVFPLAGPGSTRIVQDAGEWLQSENLPIDPLEMLDLKQE